MKNLVSMIDFVLEQDQEFDKGNVGFKELTNNVCNYAKFLKKKLELCMFVPCDKDGYVLEKPNFIDRKEYLEYYQAKERCLFDVECVDISSGSFNGFQFKGESLKMVEYNINTKRFFYGCNIIEDLIDYELVLTETSLKQFTLLTSVSKLLEAGI